MLGGRSVGPIECHASRQAPATKRLTGGTIWFARGAPSSKFGSIPFPHQTEPNTLVLVRARRLPPLRPPRPPALSLPPSWARRRRGGRQVRSEAAAAAAGPLSSTPTHAPQRPRASGGKRTQTPSHGAPNALSDPIGFPCKEGCSFHHFVRLHDAGRGGRKAAGVPGGQEGRGWGWGSTARSRGWCRGRCCRRAVGSATSALRCVPAPGSPSSATRRSSPTSSPRSRLTSSFPFFRTSAYVSSMIFSLLTISCIFTGP